MIETVESPVSLFGIQFPDLEAKLAADGVSIVHAGALWRSLHRDLVTDLRDHTQLPPPVRRWLEKHFDAGCSYDPAVVTACIPSADGYTRKLLLRLGDGQEIETVIMGYPGRYTACLSTQAGCAMGCVFCATGQMGFERNLHTGEIVAQVLHAQRRLRLEGQRLRNVVLMGMGEPLANYESVMRALNIITDARGTNIGPGRISVSTVGVVPGILRLVKESNPFNLAVSLHAVTDEERTALVPVNHRWPLAGLLDACRAYTSMTKRRIFFGWTLIEGRNDSTQHAQRLAALLQGIDSHINLIRLNPTSGFEGQTANADTATRFQAVIQAAGIPCTIRQRRGIDVGAGCGQLRSNNPLN